MAYIVQSDVITYGVDSVYVWRQQIWSPEAIPPHPGRAPVQAQDGAPESDAPVAPDGLLTLPPRP